ncbi:MAG: recombinase family protein [Oscillospiraceae bacterium]|nr:recombinase family protein [Oscillospiraceae bacterium]
MREPILAMYLRSSVEQNTESRNTSNPDESDTIANQRKLLYGEIKSRGLTEYRVTEYVDDGHTGTNFERPAFQEMIRDAKHGLVQAIIVKDFSRMGRDYIGTGDYLEQFFPSMGIRVISVNDHWDSEEHLGETLELDASFRTLLYDMYSRDLSKKRRSANQIRNENGVYCTALAPYGYQKSEADGHQLVIDPDEAEVVKRIFDMCLSGTKLREIAKTLTADGIPTPGARNYEMGFYAGTGKDFWDKEAIYRILRNEIYTGTLILNRNEFEYGTGIKQMKDRSEWKYFPDHHEAIISKDDYDEAQKIVQYVPRGKNQIKRKYYPLYCGHCGLKMYQTTKTDDLILCKAKHGAPDSACGEIYIRRQVLEKTIVELINMQVRLFGDWAEIKLQETDQHQELERKLEALQSEAAGYRENRKSLYTNYREGTIEKDYFLDKKLEYIHLEEEVTAEISKVREEIQRLESEERKLRNKTDEMKNCYLTEYDETVVRALVSKVEAFNDGHIKIHWRFHEEFPEYNSDETDTKLYNSLPCSKCAIYSSDMFYMTDKNDGAAAKKAAADYCRGHLSLEENEIAWFHDDRDDESLFYQPEFMKMTALAREGKLKTIVVRNVGDLHLQKMELHDFLFWALPRLQARFISIEDEFDSKQIPADKWEQTVQTIYEKYRGIVRGDQLLFRKGQRKNGERIAMEPKKWHCTLLYGYYHDENGCYADPEAIDWVKKIFQMFIDGKTHVEIVSALNEAGVPTLVGFYNKYELTKRNVGDDTWNSEKLAAIKRNKKYITECHYKKLCESKGRHCERKPIIDQETFVTVNEIFKYRIKRFGQ